MENIGNTDNTAYREMLLEEGRLKLQQWAFGRCLYRTWKKNRDEKYDYSNDPKAVAQAARNLSSAATPLDREEVLATFKMAWRIFHLYFTPHEIYEIDETYVALMGNVREAMRKGNVTPLIVPDVKKITRETRDEMGVIIDFPGENTSRRLE